jgi:hypothetical protein
VDAGAAEADGIPTFELETSDHSNRSSLAADSQWRTVVWRRGHSGPFGGYPVPVLASPASTGNTLSLHAAPDTNCLLDEADCPSGLHPTTSLDVVGVWLEGGPPPPSPVFLVDGVRILDGGQWVWPPAQVPTGRQLRYAVAVRNVGTTSGTAVLAAAIDILATSEHPSVHHMTGSGTVTIGPGETYQLPLAPPWLPEAAGDFVVIGPVNESGQWIGTVQQPIEVVADPVPCPVPAVNLP